MAVVEMSAWPRTAAIIGSGTPAETAAMPKKEWRRPLGHARGPDIPALSSASDPKENRLSGSGRIKQER